jgi:hypothetical protein
MVYGEQAEMEEGVNSVGRLATRGVYEVQELKVRRSKTISGEYSSGIGTSVSADRAQVLFLFRKFFA